MLAPLAAIYGTVAAARMKRAGARAAVPVICIGNPTLGGAGKTPAALAIAEMLAGMGERPAFISRGYGGRSAGPIVVDPARHHASEVGDEPLLLARAFPTIVARDRVAGAELAAKRGASIIVLDDGFQNPALAKDVSLLLIDGAIGIGNGAVFPAGPLRAPLRAQLELAQGVVLVGVETDGISKLASGTALPVFIAKLVPDAATAMILSGKKALAFAGIGHPEKFFTTLADIGVEAVERMSFPDHHRYSAKDVRTLINAAATRGLVLLTTEKDLARMQGDPAQLELAAAARTLPVRLEFSDDVAVRRLLEAALAKARARI
ncbi:MAG: tetraacyldisaccharide 4'-kinase [Xanthobacteraceae bacterium]